MIGGVGEGEALQRAWFTEERIGIAARGVGAMWRLLDEATAWALGREQGGARIMDYQGVSFPLADSAADAAAGRALTLEVARLADAGPTRRSCTRRRRWQSCSSARPRSGAPTARCRYSAAAATCARTSPSGFARASRDRFWEGTGEIQRLIVARALERRGVERTLH